MRRLCIILLLLTACTALWSQSAYDRTAFKKESSRPTNKIIRLRIDEGKVYLNDRSLPTAELPSSLQNIDPNIYYETNVAGVTEFTFNLGNRFYLVQNGKLTEVVGEGQSDATSYNSKTATEAYYSQLKRESPGLFYGLSREGALLEQIRSLLIDYSVAQGKQRDKIKEEIRLVLGQLYDINERNKELEIAELEDMIQAAKEEVQYRKAHKSDIIDNSLNNLLKE
ncbi:MAG TPA: hypothetical protein VHS96_05225 [Bacteroidia bacterium]|jgi:hypothetical protein|nr:hypothetical protein [Bacteroidia bacterium]